MLSVENLQKDFGGFVAIDGINLTVEKGDVHGIIGPNGAGKTTLFNLITGEFQPTEGTVSFKDNNITGARPEQIARLGIGRSFQIVEYFPELTVRENLRLAIRDVRRSWRSAISEADYEDRVRSVAEKVRLDGELDTVAANLSHGEKRYLDIGLVLGMDPELILFDEPAAGLNQSEIEDLELLLLELNEEYTMVVVEHNVELVMSVVDTLTVIHRGQVISHGDPETVRADEEVKEVYLGE